MRALLKLSGQVLKGSGSDVVDRDYLWQLAEVIKQVQDAGHQLAIVVGGGNLFRFYKTRRSPQDEKLNRTLADGRGILGTLFNGLWLQDVLQASGVKSELFTSAFADTRYVQPYSDTAVATAVESGTIAILAGGTGKPGLSTDTASIQVAAAIHAEAILKATHTVDGVYTADPSKNPEAVKIADLSYQRALTENLGIMDEEALKQANDANLTTIVFSIKDPANLTKVLNGETIGSIITPEAK